FMAGIFSDSLQGGAIAIDPKTGGVLAMYSAPSYDPNRFVGGIPPELWKSLNADPRRPLFNKVTQGTYPPGSTWKLATAAVALQRGLVKLDDRMPVACTGGFQFGNRYFHCWEPKGHGSLTLAEAIEKSCDVYFYQLGLKIGLSNLVAGGLKLGAREKTAIDLPAEARPIFPYGDVVDYYNRKYGKNGWSQAVVLNLSIGQGENSQTIVNMARFYTALATDGSAATPEVVRDKPVRTQILQLTPEQLSGLRAALAGVVTNGTAGSARIEGVVLAGKTGTAQNSIDPLHNHAWFVGYAPAGDPKIVVALFLEFGGHGTRAARIASKIIQSYLHVEPTTLINTDG
ncbi:MAG: penicillin-binding transpeptidase domain-containing protein, partial [Gemmatimonadaceae bacterium]